MAARQFYRDPKFAKSRFYMLKNSHKINVLEHQN